jgi:hypothetical protein
MNYERVSLFRSTDRFSTSTCLSLSRRNLSLSPYALIVASPERVSEKWEYKDERKIASTDEDYFNDRMSQMSKYQVVSIHGHSHDRKQQRRRRE